MARKRHQSAPVPTADLEEKDLAEWLRARIGETKHEAFAAEVGISRQVLSGVLTGYRQPSQRFVRSLRKHGLLSVRRVYTVHSEPSA